MWVLIYVLFLHWLADFVCQTRWMAENKSKSWSALAVHCLVYGLIFSLGLGWLLPIHQLLPFLGLNVALHFGVDAVTSRLTTYFWQKQWTYGFFATIGFDQLIHTCCLLWTANWFISGVFLR